MRGSSFMARMCCLLIGIAVVNDPLIAETRAPSFKSIRPVTRQLRELVTLGYQHSSTFRLIVDRLTKTSVIVHIVTADSLPHPLAGALNFVASIGPYRYLRISLRPDLPDDVLIATMAHELHHALEVAQASAVVDRESLRTFYRRAGDRSHRLANLECYDTRAARAAGDAVYVELSGRLVKKTGRSSEQDMRMARPGDLDVESHGPQFCRMPTTIRAVAQCRGFGIRFLDVSEQHDAVLTRAVRSVPATSPNREVAMRSQ